MINKTFARLALAATVAIVSPLTSALAASPDGKAVIETPAPVSLWEVVVEPYGWMTGIKGTTGVVGRTFSVDLPFQNLLSHLDWGGFLAGEVRRGRWGFLFDGYIAQISADGNPPGPTIASVNGVLKQGYFEFDLAYRLAEGRRGYVDAYVGGAYNYLSVETTTTSFPSRIDLPFLVTSSSANKQWADPLIGIRGQYNFNEKWFARGRLDVGGFHIVSNVTFQGSFSVGYNFNKRAFAELGYRYLLTEYQSGGFTYDLATSGMFIGMGLKF